MKKTSKSDSVPGTRKTAGSIVPPPDDALFGRVASILEQARGNVVRAVNHNMVVAYWLIGREIVMELQRGRERAGYGDDLIAGLSRRLTARYGAGWSRTNLWSYRLLYSLFPDRGAAIPHTLCVESGQATGTITEFRDADGLIPGEGIDLQLPWSHYRALIRVRHDEARKYYEREAVAGNWSVRQLERQIHTRAWDRLVSTRAKRAAAAKTEAPRPPADDEASCRAFALSTADSVTPNPLDSLKDPYVLEFLDIPDPAALHESGLEGAIIAHLRDFLLELGKGFAFVARQKRLSFDDEHLYVDLVFYSIPLRCYLLIDLKTGKLTAGDVGQMDSYVRMFDDLMAGPEDNPTIGLILCTEHNSAVARYSVLNDRTQIFASRYVTCLPTEAELAAEIQRSRALIEGRGGQR